MGWVCFTLLILWAIWAVLSNLPHFIGFALKAVAGLFMIYLCLEAVTVVSKLRF
jgi:hypothetical protein